MSALGSELRSNGGNAVVTMGTMIIPARMVPIHQPITELRPRLNALLVAQSDRHNHGEFGLAALVASFSLSF